jgi:hypothetical protein
MLLLGLSITLLATGLRKQLCASQLHHVIIYILYRFNLYTNNSYFNTCNNSIPHFNEHNLYEF